MGNPTKKHVVEPVEEERKLSMWELIRQILRGSQQYGILSTGEDFGLEQKGPFIL